MKLLLVQVPTSHLGAGEKVYPLGLSRLSSTVPRDIEKQVLDMNIAPDPWLHLKNALTDFCPDVVAFSFRNLDPLAGQMTSYLPSLKTAAMLAKNLTPKTRIIAGGPAFSLFAKQLMQKIPQIDIGIKGEGELVFPLLLDRNFSLQDISGIFWRNEGQVVSNPVGPKISMDKLPELDVISFPPSDYTKGNNYVAAMGIEGKRGCDLWCGYCLYPVLGGTSMRLRNPVFIVDEMEQLAKEHQIKLFHFTDSVVNRPTDHFEALCKELISRKLDVTWTGFFREDCVTKTNLALAQQAGLCAIYFSGDSLTRRGLKLLNKQMSLKDILKASQITTELDILTMCHFLVNLPGDTDQDIQESFNTLDKILDIHASRGNLGAVILNHIRLYPGAPITQKLIAQSKLDADLNMLYPVYHNPEEYSHILHELEARCHAAGVFSRLEVSF